MQEVRNLKRTANLVLIRNDFPQGHEQQLEETLALMNIAPFHRTVCLSPDLWGSRKLPAPTSAVSALIRSFLVNLTH